ncbi:probable cadmium/zinc-transporting ATPase HMA1, chloroplastic isoform X2 [Phoenix dactylifera]|uniref:Probable cadmium/zinc-transporting ATPase HMA1, chloroplastic isoform X2 n=1 Tax=Phoenix dactylifera TaxID=42345 RepID=A0A8B8ZKH4_PHODC|nr:probable cadmium/zinc-transporting ATPase HMA1, chloroplastic isoform X2 [Phoenix dactylifera]XP_038971969.1 probable cadmium/zinc-transporting ATPase HMA1, chloroplastic isoform X2 [Phoenix dactylifera]
MEALAFATTAGGSSPAHRFLLSRTLRPSPYFYRHIPPRRRPTPHSLSVLSISPSLRLRRLLPPRSLACKAHGHGDHDDDHHHHHHGHGHGHGGEGELNRAQEGILRFAKAVGWADLADLLREHLQLCCCSMALLLLASACPYALPDRAAKPLQNGLIAIAFPLVGVSAALDAVLNLAGGKVNIHVLMALAAFASIFMGNSLEGALLLAMFNLAHIAEEYFTSRSMIDVKELKDSHPDFALLLEVNGDRPPQFSKLNYTKIPVHDLKVGSFILVRAGEAVPVDGEVFQGSSTITIEHLTGETKPLERKVGDSIPGGARNLEGMMIVKATKSWKDSTLNKIVQLTEEGKLNKPKLQRWLDEFGEHYSKVVVALSLVVALSGPFLFKWPFIGNSVSRGSIYRALGLMVAASPCALAVAPLAYAIAISACAKKGILLKGGHVLDALAACQSIAFDKTGTLTTGKLMCKAIEPIHGHLEGRIRSEVPSCCIPNCESEALAVAAAMEKGTTHPIGRAVVDHSLGKDLPDISVESFECVPGRGLFATLAGIKSLTGDKELLKASLGSVEYVASLCKSSVESSKIKEAARTSAYGNDFVQAALSVDKKVTLFHFEDEPRHGVAEVISTLKDQAQLRIMMLTGDHESSARRVADTVGINEVHCCLKPEDKLNKVKSASRDTGGGLIMVGDGINDAPALAAATVGIVLAQRASGTAIAVADVLLLQDNISGVPFVIAKARQTTSLVKQSVALALSCIFFASLPSVLGFLPLWLTVLLHEGGTLLVCLNSIRALNNPAWSWLQDLQQLVDRLRKSVADLFNKRPPRNHVIQAAPL